MKKADDKPSISRRKFLQQSAATGGMATLVASAPALAAADTTSAKGDAEDAGKDGYRVTQHILDYYKSTTL